MFRKPEIQPGNKRQQRNGEYIRIYCISEFEAKKLNVAGIRTKSLIEQLRFLRTNILYREEFSVRICIFKGFSLVLRTIYEIFGDLA